MIAQWKFDPVLGWLLPDNWISDLIATKERMKMTKQQLAQVIKDQLIVTPMPDVDTPAEGGGVLTLGKAIGEPFGLLDQVCSIAAEIAIKNKLE